jgi:hypothetical protein
MEAVVALVALILVLGAGVVFGVLLRTRNQWDQTEKMRALRRLAGAPDEPSHPGRDVGSGSQ